jgi:hypothetical protein
MLNVTILHTHPFFESVIIIHIYPYSSRQRFFSADPGCLLSIMAFLNGAGLATLFTTLTPPRSNTNQTQARGIDILALPIRKIVYFLAALDFPTFPSSCKRMHGAAAHRD